MTLKEIYQLSKGQHDQVGYLLSVLRDTITENPGITYQGKPLLVEPKSAREAPSGRSYLGRFEKAP